MEGVMNTRAPTNVMIQPIRTFDATQFHKSWSQQDDGNQCQQDKDINAWTFLITRHSLNTQGEFDSGLISVCEHFSNEDNIFEPKFMNMSIFAFMNILKMTHFYANWFEAHILINPFVCGLIFVQRFIIIVIFMSQFFIVLLHKTPKFFTNLWTDSHVSCLVNMKNVHCGKFQTKWRLSINTTVMIPKDFCHDLVAKPKGKKCVQWNCFDQQQLTLLVSKRKVIMSKRNLLQGAQMEHKAVWTTSNCKHLAQAW